MCVIVYVCVSERKCVCVCVYVSVCFREGGVRVMCRIRVYVPPASAACPTPKRVSFFSLFRRVWMAEMENSVNDRQWDTKHNGNIKVREPKKKREIEGKERERRKRNAESYIGTERKEKRR